MRFLAAISLLLLLGDDPPKPDTTRVDTIPRAVIAQQELVQDDLDTIKIAINELKHKLDSLKKK